MKSDVAIIYLLKEVGEGMSEMERKVKILAEEKEKMKKMEKRLKALEEEKERNDQFWKTYDDTHFGEIDGERVSNGNEKEGQLGQK